jgi:hypothetical protein
MRGNRSAQARPQAILSQAWAEFSGVKTLSAPPVVALAPSKRYELPKMGGETLYWVRKAFDLARQNPNLAPPRPAMSASGTEMAAGSEAWRAALLRNPIADL